MQGVWEAKLLLHLNPPCICTSGHRGHCHPRSNLSSSLPLHPFLLLLGSPAHQCQGLGTFLCLSSALDGRGHVLLPHTKDSSSKRLVKKLSSQKTLVQHNINIPRDHFHLVGEADIILLTHFVSGSEELFAVASCCEAVVCPHLAGRSTGCCSVVCGSALHRSTRTRTTVQRLWRGAARACTQAGCGAGHLVLSCCALCLHPHLPLQSSLRSKPHCETAAAQSGVACVSPFQVLFSSRSGSLGQSLSFAGLVGTLRRSCFSWGAGEQLQPLPQKTPEGIFNQFTQKEELPVN